MKKQLTLIFLLISLCYGTLYAGYINGTMTVQGNLRKYVVYVPAIYYSQPQRVPLLIGLHGFGDNVANFSRICMSSIADTANYIVVYPEALTDPLLGSTAWNSGAGALGVIVNNTVDDVGYISRLMDTMIAHYTIDTNRMYVFGFSFGGFMTNRMAAEKANRITAAASVSGLRGNYVTANPGVSVPYLHFHGTTDPTISYDGLHTFQTTLNLPGLGMGADSTVRYWASKDGCNMTPAVDTMPDLANDGLRFVRFTYTNSTTNHKAILYKVINGVHSWYEKPTNDISYCQTIWAFFRQYSKASVPTALHYSRNEVAIKLFPNPASNRITIQADADVQSYQIWNMEGKLMEQTTIGMQREFSIQPELSKGIYLLRLFDKQENAIAEKKFVVQ